MIDIQWAVVLHDDDVIGIQAFPCEAKAPLNTCIFFRADATNPGFFCKSSVFVINFLKTKDDIVKQAEKIVIQVGLERSSNCFGGLPAKDSHANCFCEGLSHGLRSKGNLIHNEMVIII